MKGGTNFGIKKSVKQWFTSVSEDKKELPSTVQASAENVPIQEHQKFAEALGRILVTASSATAITVTFAPKIGVMLATGIAVPGMASGIGIPVVALIGGLGLLVYNQNKKG